MDVPAEKIISVVRDIMPARPVTQGEAYILAELQATRLLKLLDITSVPVDIARICDLPKIEVQVEPRHKIPSLAGFSRQRDDGHWLIVVNKSDVPGKRRFTLAHEFKHILDHTVHRIAYAHLGFGDADKRDQQVERICDHFAACVLMPRIIVKRAWASGIQNTEALADFFDVSQAAMTVRLRYLGLADTESRPIKTYFRYSAGGILTGQPPDIMPSLA